MSATIAVLEVTAPEHVVLARQRAREIAAELGFDRQDQMRIACAVSEVARLRFAARGACHMEFTVSPPGTRASAAGGSGLDIVVPDPERVLDPSAAAAGGGGDAASGLLAARRMMDGWRHDGDTARLRKGFPDRMAPLGAARLRDLSARFAGPRPEFGTLAEWQRQNHETMIALDTLARQRDELTALNTELEDTNRGVVALYAELDERAEHLRQAHEMKTRFLSNVSHEFRTPVNSIQALCRMLLDRQDGDLTEEQANQVSFIRQSAEALSDLVNDLLDIAKIDAGKLELKFSSFTCEEVVGALRGMLKPLVSGGPVDLVFDDCGGLPPLLSDQGKVAQILRNLLSNALKFTERGAVRMTAAVEADGSLLSVRVIDTGIGIAAENLERIFDEFSQIETPLHTRSKGTGLGLSLSRKLAQMLGGTLTVDSTPGQGSTFTLTIPVRHPEAIGAPPVAGSATPAVVLLVDDDAAARYVLRRSLPPGVEVHEASDGRDGLALADTVRPDVIFLDLKMPGMDGFAMLEDLRHADARPAPRVIVCTSLTLDDALRARLGGVEVLPKGAVSREAVERLGLAPSRPAGVVAGEGR